MDISINDIVENITEPIIDSYGTLQQDFYPIVYALPFSKDQTHLCNVLYVAKSEDILVSNLFEEFPPSSGKRFLCICIGTVPLEICEKYDCTMEFLDKNASPREVFEEVQRVLAGLQGQRESEALAVAENGVDFGDFFGKLIRGEHGSNLSLSQCMLTLGWDYSGDEYLCCHIGVPLTEKSNSSKEDIVRLVQDKLAEKFKLQSFFYDSSLIVIINLTKTCVNTKTEFPSTLQDFIQVNHLVCGVSSSRKSLHRLAGLYNQASIAFRQGQQEDWPIPVYHFSKVVLKYAIDCIIDTMPPELFCPEQILRLIKHDCDYSTDYYQTMKAYIENDCSATAACKELYIGRGSFNYRLEKIKIWTGFDFQSSDTRLLLLLCFKIFECYGFENLKVEQFENYSS